MIWYCNKCEIEVDGHCPICMRARTLHWRLKNPLRYTAGKLANGAAARARENAMPICEEVKSTDYVQAWLTRQPCCVACETPFVVGMNMSGVKGGRWNAPSIDRINNDKGYTLDNIELLCLSCNRIKSDMLAERLFKLADWLKRRHTAV